MGHAGCLVGGERQGLVAVYCSVDDQGSPEDDGVCGHRHESPDEAQVPYPPITHHTCDRCRLMTRYVRMVRCESILYGDTLSGDWAIGHLGAAFASTCSEISPFMTDQFPEVILAHNSPISTSNVRALKDALMAGASAPLSWVPLRAASCRSCNHSRSAGVRNDAVRGLSASWDCRDDVIRLLYVCRYVILEPCI